MFHVKHLTRSRRLIKPAQTAAVKFGLTPVPATVDFDRLATLA